MTRSLRNLRFLGKLFSVFSSIFLLDSLGYSYRKKDCSKDKVNVAEITQKGSQKMKRKGAMASFNCLVSKVWKKSILCCFSKGK